MPATYFLAPSWDINPDEVSLGSVIANVKTPNRALSAATLPSLIHPPISLPKEERPFSGIARKSREWTAGLFSTFVQVITFGGELSVSSNTAVAVEYSCELLATQRFTPSPEYLAKAVGDPGVIDHLKMGGLREKVFMITGIKTVHNATITTTEEAGKEINVQLGVEVPAVDVTVGPKLSHKSSDYRQTTRMIEGPIVFAFEVEKLRVNRKGKVKHGEYILGAVLGRGKAEEDASVVERAGNGLDEDEAEDLDVDIRLGADDETGEVCEIVVP
ncbi:hypothetical protein BCR34DRAFT_572489 [Clohesyomyces aquaticus]|uniref:Uncharacterized protein n=1 Tax=Clohesyomyces aquaticus TaxID=1231657 RepID=A0A1Y1Z3C3_9PLEO|nr:hypothetical protein BCR34DRAFT_572489 [Clohesyomyces aquaticus]